MPSRKQRRRREKSRRHEYEYVYVDEEGREVELDPVELEGSRNGKADAKPAPSPRTAKGRRVDPPSWRRAAKRGLLFAPIMFVTIMLLGGSLSLTGQILQTLYLVVLFVPFSYFLDRVVYRRSLRQAGGQSGSSSAKARR